MAILTPPPQGCVFCLETCKRELRAWLVPLKGGRPRRRAGHSDAFLLPRQGAHTWWILSKGSFGQLHTGGGGPLEATSYLPFFTQYVQVAAALELARACRRLWLMTGLRKGGAAPWDLNSVAFPFKGHIEVNRNMGPSQSPHGFTGRNVPSFW